MSRIVAISFLMLLNKHLILDAAEYDEEPFRKFTVLFQKLEGKSHHDVVTVNLRGEQFRCDVPSEAFLQSLSRKIPTVEKMSKRINGIPCIVARDHLWTYVLCPQSGILLRSRVFPFVKLSLGTKFTDRVTKVSLKGFKDKGDRAFLTRRFTDGSWCDFERRVRTDVHFHCRQDSTPVTRVERTSSPCEYTIHLHTRLACSDDDVFESEYGYPLYCRPAEQDAVLEPIRYSPDGNAPLLNPTQLFEFFDSEKFKDRLDTKMEKFQPINEVDEIVTEALESHVDLSIVAKRLSGGGSKPAKISKQYYSGFQHDKIVFDEWKPSDGESENEKIKRKVSYMKLGPSLVQSDRKNGKKKKKSNGK